MNFFKTLFLFSPLFAAAQVDIQAANKCRETNYQFFRQGQQEQQSSKIYDKKGNLLSQIDTFSSRNTGDYTNEYTYEYDANGNNSQIVYKLNGQIKKVTKKSYNGLGKLLSESISADGKVSPLSLLTTNDGEKTQVFYAQDGTTELSKEKSLFNKAGQLVKKELSSANGILMMSEIKSYDLQGNITQNTHFDAADQVTLSTNYEYDAKGNLLNDKTFRNNIILAETKNEYDLAGKLIKKTRLNAQNQVDYHFTYEYDLLGNMIKENYFYNNQVMSIRTFEYDTNGNKIKESYLDRTGNISMYKVWAFDCK
ncbi:hypothetical protein [Emticicia sp. SJ17W-69]|uniref:hypothetical protein n=1 Tax=Emticicia sp. SJ17W-69 TaxID=3421657 RepID=UPI003EB87826